MTLILDKTITKKFAVERKQEKNQTYALNISDILLFIYFFMVINTTCTVQLLVKIVWVSRRRMVYWKYRWFKKNGPCVINNICMVWCVIVRQS